MSNEEAILVLQNDAYVLYEDDMPYDRQAYYMAIKALEEKRIKTNADRIRAMTDEELVKQFAVEMGFCCPVKGVDCSLEPDCRVCFARWLKKEVSDA